MLNKELQQKVERLVNNEVLTCQTSLVEMLLQNELIHYDEITNVYIDNSEAIEEAQNEIYELEDKEELTEEEQAKIDELQNNIEELEEEQENPQDIFEWWVVSNWLANKLEEYGEPVLRSNYETWWGRTCTGQSISMDYIMERIIIDLENK